MAVKNLLCYLIKSDLADEISMLNTNGKGKKTKQLQNKAFESFQPRNLSFVQLDFIK